MGHRFIVEKDYPGRFGVLKPGTYAIPADISMGDAKAARADGYGRIERDAPPATQGGGQDAAQPFPPGYEHKEQPAAAPAAVAPAAVAPAAVAPAAAEQPAAAPAAAAPAAAEQPAAHAPAAPRRGRPRKT